MDVVTYVISMVVNIGLVSLVARRLLGVPVGWPRTILLSIVVQSAATGLLTWTGTTLGLSFDENGSELGQTAAILALVLAWVLAAQVTLLAILEAFVPTGTVPGPLAFLRSLPSRQRRALRYTTIVRIAAKHGLGAYLRPSRRRVTAPQSKVAASLRAALTDGGVTFVKLGQMLSSRPDLLPPAFVAELSTLQNKVAPRPWSEVKEVLEEDLGRPAAEVFAHVDEQPLAAASVGQVHLGVLPTGEQVVVKVQRREARAQATADLDIVLRLAAWLERTAGWARRLGVLDLAQGFAASLEEELDYRIELSNMRSVAQALDAAGHARVTVPLAYDELSSRRVLVMSRLPGRPVSQAGSVLRTLGPDTRQALAADLLGTVMHQVVVTGVFHADLHPGNILLADDGSLGLLDFGSVGRLDAASRGSIGNLLAAFDRQDSIAATDALLDLLDRGDVLDDRTLERELGQVILRHSGPGTSTAAMFVELFRMVMRHGLSVPPQVGAAFRALAALESSLTTISPGVDVVQLARDQRQSLVADAMSPEKARVVLETQLATLLPTLQRLPRRLNKITEDLQEGRFGVNVRLLADPRDRAFISGIVHQFVMTVLAAACTIGGIVLLAADGGPMMTTTVRLWSFLGFVLLFFGFVLASRLLVLVFHQHRTTAASDRG